jgi:hypothetical protein
VLGKITNRVGVSSIYTWKTVEKKKIIINVQNEIYRFRYVCRFACLFSPRTFPYEFLRAFVSRTYLMPGKNENASPISIGYCTVYYTRAVMGCIRINIITYALSVSPAPRIETARVLFLPPRDIDASVGSNNERPRCIYIIDSVCVHI